MTIRSLPDPETLAVETFQHLYAYAPTHLAMAPGRVNVIGEHIDYNDGFVLPAALGFRACLAFAARTDEQVRIHATAYGETLEFSVRDVRRNPQILWINYIMGMAWALADAGIDLRGFDGVLSGNVPMGSGLSSSAAVAIATGLCLKTTAQANLPDTELALQAQRAENEFVGVSCGIMDPFISMLGQGGCLLLLDCRSLAYRQVALPDNVALVIGNTQASRSLADSAYNQRRAECDEGLVLLQQCFPDITSWRDVTSAQVAHCRAHMSDNVYRRAWHVVSEIDRTLRAATAFAEDDMERAGAVMYESHVSLRDNYEVSSPALDAMVDIMMSQPGCLGARLTGAGFGGCVVGLVRTGQEEEVRAAILAQYPQRMSLQGEVYISTACAGAQVKCL